VLALQYDRSAVLAMGTVCWAISTAAVGISQNIGQVAFWRAANGFGLAIVIPVLQSFVADSYGDGSHGAGFGLFSLVSMIGRMGGGPLATIMAGQDYWGIPGWRFAFLMMASVSLLIGVLVHLFVVDPKKISPVYLGSDVEAERYKHNEKWFLGLLYCSVICVSLIHFYLIFSLLHVKFAHFCLIYYLCNYCSIFYRSSLVGGGKVSPSSPSLWHDSWIAMRSVAKVKTFQIIVLQGIVGSLPWASIVFFTMWFELIGMQNSQLFMETDWYLSSFFLFFSVAP
jgi:MFS family permease